MTKLEPGEILFLSRDDIERIVSVSECIRWVEETFRWTGEGSVEQTDPVNFWLPGDEYGMGAIQAFPSIVKPLDVAGNKWLSVYLRNSDRNLPSFTAINVITDIRTGMPLAVMEGQSITAMRTAGHAGIGAKYLARENSSTVSIVGCGSQGRTHLRVIDELFDIDTVKTYDHRRTNQEAFVAEMGEDSDLDFVTCADAKEAVEGADIVCTVTSAEEPVVREPWIDAGTHVAATSAFLDLDHRYSRTADKWVVGWKERDTTWISGEESGNFGPEALSDEDVDSDLVEIIAGRQPGREREDERTLLTHAGMPALDTAVSYLLFERARERDVGTKLDLW